MDKSRLTQRVKEYAQECGLDILGITSPEAFEDYIVRLTQNAFMYEEGYTKDRVEKWKVMAQPRELLPDARSVIVGGFYYLSAEKMDNTRPGKPCGKFGRVLSHGHAGVYKRIVKLAEFLTGAGYHVKGGIHRKSAAVRAGLGFIGKHTLVVNEQFGSWVAYQVLVTDADLEHDPPHTQDGCGDCTNCMDACPTHALYAPHKLDPRRCITYLLNQESIPIEFRDKMGNWLLGCDLCQEACPYNHQCRPKERVESVIPEQLGLSPPLLALLHMNETFFRSEVLDKVAEKFALAGNMFVEEMVPNTFQKAGGKMLMYLRNVVLALGNIQDPVAVPDLIRLLEFPHPLIRSQAAWSLGKIGTTESKQALERAFSTELDGDVKAEIRNSLMLTTA